MNYEDISFKIISKTGEAKYNAIQAHKVALSGDFDKAYILIDAANSEINNAALLHMDVITKEANGKQLKFSVLFMHAEDQFLTTQTFILTTKMMIDQLKYVKDK